MRNKDILFISKGENAASTRYRALFYFNALRASGWRPYHLTAYNSPLSRLKLLHKAAQADVVVILRKTFSTFFLHLLSLCSKHLVFDLDDAIFCRSNGTPSKTRQNRFKKVARHCQQIWAGNSYLANAALRYNPSVITLPTSLAPEKYSLEIKKPDNRLDLVWIGSSSTRKYLESALYCMERVADTCPSLRLKIVADFNLPSQRLCTVSIPWSQDKEAEALVSAHIGIAPMPSDSWTQGKCGLKLLQYMAAGLPVVSSPAGVNEEIVEHGVTGFLAESPEEWKTAIKKLADDPELRKAMGEAGRKRVIEHYSVDATFHKMSKALNRLFA
ncbi:MAG: glycosyltransferase family 4 protein [Deltaproteobacteria bacterium]|nr:glycosyltransferase family 4 protein [Deltaproteobacteria bacterium]MBW2010636.1 glycosyltransferase family 4 protein [Deltaproteobacteria bacterium]